jgi:glyoxylase I family protein
VEPVGVHHVSINVDDVDAAVAFYTDALGFRLRTDRPDFGFGGAWLDVGSQQVHLIAGTVPDARGQHYAVQVHALDDVIAELRRRGITVSDPIPVGRNRQAFLDDPAGNAIELHEVGSAG